MGFLRVQQVMMQHQRAREDRLLDQELNISNLPIDHEDLLNGWVGDVLQCSHACSEAM
jgi:hypothetical protein